MSRESQLQQRCIKYLDEKGIYYVNIHGAGWSAKGAPDLIVCLRGRFMAFELKVGENDMQPDQRIHKKRIERNEGGHYCPRTLDGFIRIVKKEGQR